uniref:Obscurin like cytoskeletal adaptor 1a n=1 Tax=Neogobius melanostomus TaxID=47308 RepID=A0A8C6U010_9GOBI
MDVFGGAPRVLGYPRPLVAQPGTDATLRCQIGGDPRPDVVWERKNVQISSEGRYRLSEEGKAYLLTITAVTAEDAGQYICKARNKVGETCAAATLKVEGQQLSSERPRFLIKPLSLRVDRGEDAAFSCKIWGTPTPEVEWEKDGKKLGDIFENSHFSVNSQEGGWFQLKVYRTRMPDKGVYTCKAVNCNGEALAGAVLLVELVPEREDSKSAKDDLPVSPSKVKKFAVAEGKHAKFRCLVTGKPKPEIVWKKDGVALDPGRRHLVFEDREGYYTLKVLYCKSQDTGLYVCAASNALGNTLSAVHLTVKGASVRFRRQLKDVEVSERDVAVLECEVPDESLPAAWYLEDQRLMPGQKYGMEEKGNRRRLTIRDVGTDDDGVYLCEMPDGAKSIAELTVKGTIVKKLPRKLEVLEGENAAFCVEVEHEDMEVHWFKDGLKLHETHHTILKSFGKTHMLVFVNVSHQDSGVVTFVAGRSTTTSRLKVKATRHCPPICPGNIKMDVDRPNSALLTWSPAPNSQTTTRSMFVVERQEVGSLEWQRCFASESATSAEVSGDSMPCEGDYRFRVCSINKYGRSGHVEFPNVVHLGKHWRRIQLMYALCKTRNQVTQGEEAHFSIELSIPMAGTWFLNSSQLQNGGRFSVRQSDARHTLVIQETRAAEDGAEITFIANGVRDSALLNVRPILDQYTLVVDRGETIVLYCELSHRFADVSWFKDGEELRAMDGLNIQSDANMRRVVIHEAEEGHSGVYTCKTAQDAIEFKVEVAVDDLHKSSMELDPVVLVCHVSREDADVIWFKNGSEVQPDEHVTVQAEGTMRRLIIRSATTTDAGSYTCQAGSNSMEFTVNPPVMIVEPKDDIVVDSIISQDVHLQCELSRSNGRVRWSKDGHDVEEGDNIQLVAEGPYRRLTVLSCTAEDSGEYVCETDGDSVFFQLNITEPPVCFTYPTEPEVQLTHTASERLELCCEISKADATVVWYRDGLEVEETSNLVLEVDGAKRRLVIPVPTPDDTGEYVCDTEDDSVAFQVTITGRSNVPEKLKCSTDKPVVLEVEVSRPNAEVKWLVEGREIGDSSNVTKTEDGLIRRLTIHCPSPDDSGRYTCEAVDDRIDFQVKVSGIIQPQYKSDINTHVTSTLSDDVVLECELSRPSVATKWYKDSNRIENDERFCIEEDGAFRSLIILCAELGDSGEYFLDALDDSISFQVTVEGEYFISLPRPVPDFLGGVVQSIFARILCKKKKKRRSNLTVCFRAPVRIIGNSSDVDFQDMAAGDELILACEVSRPNAQVQWYCNDQLLSADSRVYIESYGTLRKIIISDIQPSDSGKYVCDAGDDKMVSIVRVQGKRVEDIVLIGYEAESVTLTSYVSKDSALVRWLKDWTPVDGERFKSLMDGHKRTLIIDPLRRSDAGEYTCDSDISNPAVLWIREPDTTIGPNLKVNGMVTLCCEVAKPKADVQWLQNGKEIVPSRRFTIRADGVERSLTIHRLSRDDAGEYVCESKDDRTAAVLTVEMPRVVEFLTELHNTTVLEGEDATFKCVVSPEDVRLVWLMDNEPVAFGERFEALRNGLCHTLVIHKCHMLDCSRITVNTQVLETVHLLNVLPLDVQRCRMDTVNAEEFEEATLQTEISLETGEVQWMRQGVVIQPGPRYTLAQSGRTRTLTIHNLTLSDRGTYRCETLHDRTQVKLNVEPHYHGSPAEGQISHKTAHPCFKTEYQWSVPSKCKVPLALSMYCYSWCSSHFLSMK